MTISATEDSRLDGTGSLTLDGTAFAKQANAVSLVPAVAEEGERMDMLNGNTLLPSEVVTWTLNVGLVQDFQDPDGLVEFLRSRAGESVAFVWEPTGTGPAYSGTVKLRPTTIGGTVKTRLTQEVVLPVVGDLPDPTYPGP